MEKAYDHTKGKLSEASGIDLDELKGKINKFNREAVVKRPSQLVELMENSFTPRELAFLYFQEKASNIPQMDKFRVKEESE